MYPPFTTYPPALKISLKINCPKKGLIKGGPKLPTQNQYWAGPSLSRIYMKVVLIPIDMY